MRGLRSGGSFPGSPVSPADAGRNPPHSHVQGRFPPCSPGLRAGLAAFCCPSLDRPPALPSGVQPTPAAPRGLPALAGSAERLPQLASRMPPAPLEGAWLGRRGRARSGAGGEGSPGARRADATTASPRLPDRPSRSPAASRRSSWRGKIGRSVPTQRGEAGRGSSLPPPASRGLSRTAARLPLTREGPAPRPFSRAAAGLGGEEFPFPRPRGAARGGLGPGLLRRGGRCPEDGLRSFIAPPPPPSAARSESRCLQRGLLSGKRVSEPGWHPKPCGLPSNCGAESHSGRTLPPPLPNLARPREEPLFPFYTPPSPEVLETARSPPPLPSQLPVREASLRGGGSHQRNNNGQKIDAANLSPEAGSG